ncbi:hypothetical protein ACFB49_27070 [Sphingomonas sp. DBB INV C78]|uniref:hypothetical protein n=1 Tax=Sphingomonas sp. DBB INV C78 TaxID=3349434 RepID=UPI0036D3989D
MAIELEAPAMLLVGPEVRLSNCSLCEALAAAIALEEGEWERAAIIYDGGDKLNPAGILAVAEANNIIVDDRFWARRTRPTDPDRRTA